MSIEKVISKFESMLLRLPNVTSVGIGEHDGEEVIIVFVSRKVPESDLAPGDIVPKKLDRFRTDVQVEIKIG